MGLEFDTTQPMMSNSGGNEVLPTDVYVMKIQKIIIEDDKFGQPDRDGNQPQKLVITWEIERLTMEQEQAGIRKGEKVWQRFNPYYGFVKDGGPSKFKAFIDSLVEQGILPVKFKPDDLVGIVQRVSVEEYQKTMGPNAGQHGNRVIAVAPLQVQRRRPPHDNQSSPPDDEGVPL